MRKRNKQLVLLMLVVSMSFGMLGSKVSATEKTATASETENTAIASAEHPSEYDGHEVYASSDGRYNLSISSVSSKNVWSYDRVNVNVNGEPIAVKGIVINSTHYIPAKAAANVLGASYSYNSASKVATMRSANLTLVMGVGCYVNYANDRVLFSMTPNVMMSDGRLYIPAHVFAKAIGMTASISDGSLSISGRYSPIIPADRFYREDEVFWLGRIIHAEAQGEPLLGKIAVGNVVLNRVKSPYYPNTIYGVIFDRKYGVQFSPIIDGAIYNTPNYNSTLAAKICLEGFDISDGAFFFLEPRLSTSSWIPKNREYAFTINKHDFYR